MFQLLEREKIHHLLPWSVVEDLGEEDSETEVDLEVPEEEDMDNCGTDDDMEVSLEDSFADELLNSEEKGSIDIDKDNEIAEKEDEDMSEIEILSSGDEDDEDGDVSFVFVPSKKIKTEY